MQAKVEKKAGKKNKTLRAYVERQGTLPDAGADSYLLSDFQGMADYQYEAGFLQLQGQRAVGICRT